MEANQLHRGRMIDHLQLVVADLGKSRAFYQPTLAVLGIPVVDGPDFFYADELFVSGGEPLTGRAHFAFQAPDEETVRRWYEAGLAAGGVDNGAPGYRNYHPGYYAAFLLDPDGNNVEAVYHGPANRSAASIVITF